MTCGGVCGADACGGRWAGTAASLRSRMKNNAPPVIAATSAIQAAMSSTDGRFRLGRATVGAPLVGADMITVGSLSSWRGGTLIGRVSGPSRVGRHFGEQAAEGRQAIGAVERAQHRPDRRLIRRHHRLL